MNVYDFDGTIFPTDCTIGFGIWCMNRHPKLWFKFFPKMVVTLIRRKAGKIPEYLMQRKLLGYLTLIDDFDVQIERYWDKNEKKIAPWYLKQKRDDDLIISASPSCIIEPIANRLGVKFMATEFDREFGVFTNNLMYAKEKAKYIFQKPLQIQRTVLQTVKFLTDGGKRNLYDYRFIQINKQRNREENASDKETDHTVISMHNDFGALLRMCPES